jgi:hypothetical protein
MSYPELWRDAHAAIEQLRSRGLFDTERGKRALETAQAGYEPDRRGPKRGRSGSGSDSSDGGGRGNPQVPREPPLAGPVLSSAKAQTADASTTASGNGGGGVSGPKPTDAEFAKQLDQARARSGREDSDALRAVVRRPEFQEAVSELKRSGYGKAPREEKISAMISSRPHWVQPSQSPEELPDRTRHSAAIH